MASTFQKPPGLLVLALVGGALSLLFVFAPDEPAEPIQPFPPIVCPPLVSIDARDERPDDVVDLAERASAGGCSTDPDDLFLGAQPVRVLEVLDTNVLRLKTPRGEEIVALEQVRGTSAALPEEINAYLRETAVPALERFLDDGHELYEVRWSAFHTLFEFPDSEGRRVVDLQRAAPGGAAQSISAEVVQRGWGFAVPNGIPDAQLHPHMFLGEPGLPAVGLRALPAWKALTATYDEGFEAVLTLTDEQLTRRARDVQEQLARLLGWTPREPIRVEWLNPVEFRERHLARAKASPMTNTDGTPRWTDEQLEQQADQAQRATVAWSPEGPVIQLVRRRWGHYAGLDLLDELLAHELVHQYQEEVFGLYDEGRFDEDMVGLPLEGHAGHLTQRWLDARAPGATHTPHPQAVREFELLLELTSDTPDELVRRFHDGMWSNLYPSFCSGFLLFPGDPWQPQPVVEVVSAGERPVLKLTNLGDAPLAGLYNGRWCAIDKPYSPFSHRALPASPPFHLLLPKGASVQVRLTDALDGAEVGTRVRTQWSPTPSLVEMR